MALTRDRAAVEGYAEPGFEPVRAELERNLRERGELGAACAVYLGGEKVVDVWGGLADRHTGREWEEDTLVLVFSTSKGVAATTFALARARGLVDYEQRVAAYWPEFAQRGKEEMTVRELLAHRGGLPAISARLDPETIGDADRLAAALAAERPAWRTGTRHGYHALSIGWYESALMRRADPAGRSLGRYFADEIAPKLEIEFYFGLPEGFPERRLARLESMPSVQMLDPRALPSRMVLALAWPRSLTSRTFRNPHLRRPADLFAPEYRPLEIPAGGGIGSVRSIAAIYGDLAVGGARVGLDGETAEMLSEPQPPPSGGDVDLVLKAPAAYSLGFVRPHRAFSFGSSPRAFGHPGAGGSFAFADPDIGLGFAYAPNRLGYHLVDDPRERALREVVYRCVRQSG